MKTFLLTSLAFIGIAVCAPDAQARDCDRYQRGYHSHYRERPSYGYSHHRSTYYYPRESYRRSYHVVSPRYYRSERCYTERHHSYRRPLISFLFGF